MRRLLVISTVMFLSLTACKKKSPEPAADAGAAATPSAEAGGFVDIQIDAEEDLAGSELMMATAQGG